MSKGPCSALQPGVHWLFTQKSQGHGMQTEVKFERWWGSGPSFPKGESLPTYWVEVVGLGPLRLQPNFPFSLSKNRKTLRTMTYLSFSSLSSTYTFLSNVVCSWSLPPLALFYNEQQLVLAGTELNDLKGLGRGQEWMAPYTEQSGPCSHDFSSLGNEECASIPQCWTLLFFYILHSFLDFTHNLKSLV